MTQSRFDTRNALITVNGMYTLSWFKYRIFLLLGWLQLKTRKFSLICYLTHSGERRDEFTPFLKELEEIEHNSQLEFELRLPNQLSVQIIIPLTIYSF